MEKARRACEAIFLDEGLPQIIVEITSSNSNIYNYLPCAHRTFRNSIHTVTLRLHERHT